MLRANRTTIGRTAMAKLDLQPLDQALMSAHQPALAAALVQITGDPHWLRDEWKPAYVPLSRGETGVSEAQQAKFRAEAKAALIAYFENPRIALPAPSGDLLQKMMSFVAGADLPEGYGEFLTDELALSRSTKDPHWDTPKLKAAARKMHVLVIGAGMSGLLTGIRLAEAGIDFEIVEKNADVGGTWLENTYPGCRVDSSNHIYSYSFEPNHNWPQHFSTQPVLL